MHSDRTSRLVRGLLSDVDRHEVRVPVASLIEMASSAKTKVTIDRNEDPPIVIVQPVRSRRFDTLSPREGQVAALVAAGKTNREIADELYISVATAKDHVHAILVKTGLSSRSAVIAAWYGGRH